MRTRSLGKTDIKITELGFGGAPLGNLYKEVSDEIANELVLEALDAGINYFDTSPYYGFGLSERRLGDALRTAADKNIVVSSKVGRLLEPDNSVTDSKVRYGFASPMPFKPVYDYSYDGVMRSFEASLQRLRLNQIDILYIHDLGQLIHGDGHDAMFKIAMEGGYKALDELRSEGTISAIGLGVNEWQVCEQVMEYGRFDCFLLAGRYTLLEQFALESFFPKCENYGATIILGGVYNSGVLATGTKTNTTLNYNYEPASDEIIQRVQKIEAVCDEFDIALSAAALQFPLAHPLTTSVIPGLGDKKRISQTMALYETKIPCSFWAALLNEGLLDERAPIPAADV